MLYFPRQGPLLPSNLVAPDPDPVLAATPAGAIVQVGHTADGIGTATFDRSRRYRYRLSRVWDARLPRCCFIMLNPSTADAHRLDPTIRRCVGFARGWGHGAVEVVNVFALRATHPEELRRAADPVGPGCDTALLAGARAASSVIAAWGTAAALGDRADGVRRLLADAGIEPSVLRLTRAGAPGHPLYLRADARPIPWCRDSPLSGSARRPQARGDRL